jgi:hypothetical protein
MAGTWSFAGRVSSNTCTFLQNVPEFQIGTVYGDRLVVTQNGQNLTAVDSSGELTYAGTVSGNSFTLTLTNPLTDTGGTCTFSTGSGIVVNKTSDNAGDGSWTITTTRISGDCSPIEPLPCSVVITGSWGRTSATKLASQEPSIHARFDRLQELLSIYLR